MNINRNEVITTHICVCLYVYMYLYLICFIHVSRCLRCLVGADGIVQTQSRKINAKRLEKEKTATNSNAVIKSCRPSGCDQIGHDSECRRYRFCSLQRARPYVTVFLSHR